MAVINFDFAGWQYEQAIETLRIGFVEAISTLERQIAGKRDEIMHYEESVKNGGDPIGEWDEDGAMLWHQSQLLEFEATTLESACMSLRKAMVMQLYHLWEREVRVAVKGKSSDDHKALVAKLAEAGCIVHSQLDAVQHLVNTLKHGSGRSGNKLLSSWPELVITTIRFSDWYERIALSDDHVGKVAEIVAASYPR